MHLEADAARSGRPSLVTFNQKSLRFGFLARFFVAPDAALQSWEGCRGMCPLLARLSFNFVRAASRATKIRAQRAGLNVSFVGTDL